MVDAYACPFCQWPNMKIVDTPAIDVVGNEYKHGKCECGAEAVYLLKPNPKVHIRQAE
ncbi:MAG: hypothetical protein GY751_26235 [Bacteroidetes bacterium]|nr:hypothetical protein [Bacteroidota bacterium]